MLTTEQINAIRDKYKNYGKEPIRIIDHAMVMAWMESIRNDIYTLLDALEEAAADKKIQDADYELLKQVISRNDEHMADRDRWKKRAEAMELALKTRYCPCRVCKKHITCDHPVRPDCLDFDEAQFAGEGGGEQ